MNRIDDIFNPNTPSDLTKIKDYPKAVRDKAVELYNLIKYIEASKTSSSITETLELLPTLQYLFLKGNPNIPSGLYLRNQNEWYGHSNYDFLPPTNENSKEGERVAYNGKIYELFLEGENKIWSEKLSFYPKMFYDFFKIKESRDGILENYGNDLDIKMEYRNISHLTSEFLPYIKTSKNSVLRTLTPYLIDKSFTLTGTFFNVSRTYEANLEVINPSHIGIIYFIKDEFENVKIGVGIDKDNRLVVTNFTDIYNTNFVLLPNTTVQISVKFLDGKLSVLIDGYLAYETNIVTINNKRLLFSICDDYNYGAFANTQATLGEIEIFKEALSIPEIIWNKESPRTWTFQKPNNYLELTIEEKVKLKEFLKTL